MKIKNLNEEESKLFINKEKLFSSEYLQKKKQHEQNLNYIKKIFNILISVVLISCLMGLLISLLFLLCVKVKNPSLDY